MSTFQRIIQGLVALSTLFVLSLAVFGADPGLPIPFAADSNDQRPAALVVGTFFTSIADRPALSDTRIDLTNTNPVAAETIHLFLVDGKTCSVADTYLCLTQSQTHSFLASEEDPNVTGYLIAVVVDQLGMPLPANVLIMRLTGSVLVTDPRGTSARFSLNGIGFSAGFTRPPTYVPGASPTVNLNLNGKDYSQAPRVLATVAIPSREDNYRTLLIVDRVDSDLTKGGATIGTLFGIVHDDAENAFSTAWTGGCQDVVPLGANNQPRVIGGWSLLIPAGHTGWLKFWSALEPPPGIVGAQIDYQSQQVEGKAAFIGSGNLHHLTLVPSCVIKIPVHPPTC